MSQENVELVLQLIPPPEVDLAPLIRDPRVFESMTEPFAPLIDPEVECLAMWGEGKSYRGVDGFREMWRDWLEPWSEYRVQIEETLDAGENVVLLIRDRARREGVAADVELVSASIWQIRDGRIVRVTFCRDRSEALRAVGLPESDG